MWCALSVSSTGSRFAGTAVPSVRKATTSWRSSSTKPATVSASAHASAAAARSGVVSAYAISSAKTGMHERQVARLVLQPGVGRDEVEDREDRRRSGAAARAAAAGVRAARRSRRRALRRSGSRRPRVPSHSNDHARRRPSASGSVATTRLCRCAVHGPSFAAGMERVPVVAQVSEQPRQRADERRGQRRTSSRAATSRRRQTSQPSAGSATIATCGLDQRPQPRREAEQHEVAARHALGEPQHEQQDREAEEELRSVEAVRAGRLPVEVRRPDPEERRREHRAPLVEHAQADAPDEDGRGRPEQRRRRCGSPTSRGRTTATSGAARNDSCVPP